jgi:hypothetical protein
MKSTNDKPPSHLKRDPNNRVISAAQIKEIWDYIYSEDTIIRQCLSMLHYYVFEGGFDIETRDGAIPTLFLDEEVRTALYWFFHNLQKWIHAVGFAPIVFPKDMTMWATDRDFVRKIIQHFYDKINNENDQTQNKTDYNTNDDNHDSSENESDDDEIDEVADRKRKKKHERSKSKTKTRSSKKRKRDDLEYKDTINTKAERHRAETRNIPFNKKPDGKAHKVSPKTPKRNVIIPEKSVDKDAEQRPKKRFKDWSSNRNYASINSIVNVSLLPMSIPDPFMGDFEIYINKKNQKIELIYVPHDNYKEIFEGKRVVVYMSKLYELDSGGTIRTDIASLLQRFKIKQVILETNLKAQSELSKQLVLTEITPENKSIGDMTTEELAREVISGLNGGSNKRWTAEEWRHIDMAFKLNSDRSNPQTKDESQIKYSNDTPTSIALGVSRQSFNGVVNDQNSLTLNNIRNEIIGAIRCSTDQDTTLKKSMVPLAPGMKGNLSRPGTILNPREYNDEYMNEVCVALGVPYHLIATEKGKYTPKQDQLSMLIKTISMLRTELEYAFMFIYNEAFSVLDGKLVEDVISRLNELTDYILEDLTIHQLDKVYNKKYTILYPINEKFARGDAVRDAVVKTALQYQMQKCQSEFSNNSPNGDKTSAPSKSNQLMSEKENNNLIKLITSESDIDQTISSKQNIEEEVIDKELRELDETSTVLANCRINLFKILSLIEKSSNMQNRVNLAFKVKPLTNLETLERFANFAINNPPLYALVMEAGYNLFTSTQ